MLKINKLLNYSTIILKTDELIPGYYMFNIDLFGNIIQNKTFKPGSLEELKLELKILCIYNRYFHQSIDEQQWADWWRMNRK